MKRRAYLASLAGSTVALSGCTAPGKPRDESQPEYYGRETVVHEYDGLSLSLRQDTVRLGETIEFEVTNTGDSEVMLGCHNPWAVQKYTAGEWRHVTWTSGRYYDLCLTLLSPENSLVEGLTFSQSELEKQASTVRGELTPGRYRFVLLGTSPYFAIDFDVLDSQ